MTLEEAIKRIKEIADNWSKFKIGKTGQEIQERFDSEYQDDYDEIKAICSSLSKKLIDQWEIDLIEYFQNDADYQDKCDNDAVGGGDMGEAEKYHIYVVVKR